MEPAGSGAYLGDLCRCPLWCCRTASARTGKFYFLLRSPSSWRLQIKNVEFRGLDRVTTLSHGMEVLLQTAVGLGAKQIGAGACGIAIATRISECYRF